MKTPLLFIVFNRPDTTARVFEEIRKAKPCRFFIAADGVRVGNEDDKVLCQKTKDIVKNVDWNCEVKTLFQEKNLGFQKDFFRGTAGFQTFLTSLQLSLYTKLLLIFLNGFKKDG